MNDFYMSNLENSNLQNILNGYKENFKKLVGLGTEGILGIREWTKNLKERDVWTGRQYNNVVNFWNDVTSNELYQVLQTYYNCFASAQNIVDIYAGLEMPFGGTDVGGSAEISDEDYSALNEKLPTTSVNKTKVELLNIRQFYIHVSAFDHRLDKNITELNTYIEENFKNKSTTLDLFVEMVKNANNNYSSAVKSILNKYSERIERSMKILQDAEEASLRDTNKM